MQVVGDALRRDPQDGLQMVYSLFQRPAGFGIVQTADVRREIGSVVAGQTDGVLEKTAQRHNRRSGLG